MKRFNIILIRNLLIFLLFAIFLFLFMIPIYSYIADFNLRNELTHISNRLEQGAAALDSVITALNLVVISSYQDSRFSVFRSGNYFGSDLQQINMVSSNTLLTLRDLINNSLLPYSLLTDAGLMFPGGAAITRKSVYYYPLPVSFYGHFLQCNGLTLAEWQEMLGSIRTFLPVMQYNSLYYGLYDAITYSAHWAYTGLHEEIFFFAALSTEGIAVLLADADVIANANIAMYSPENELLFSMGNLVTGPSHKISSRSSDYSLIYEINVPASFIENKLRPVRQQMFLYSGIIIILIFILSFLFAWRSSLPEWSFLKQMRPGKITQMGINVFAAIKHIYMELAGNFFKIENQLESSLKTLEIQTALIKTQTINRIKKALLAGDEAAARIILKDCIASLPQPEDPLIAAMMSEMLSVMICEIKNELSGIYLPAEAPVYVPGSQKEIFDRQYPECFAQICGIIRTHNAFNNPESGREIVAYINEKLFDPGLYITMVLDHFEISAPTLQKLMKQCTGQTFQNYVEKLRLDRACELLLNNPGSITRIARECGYSSIASFTRSFKRIYGFPPSRFQKK